MCSSDLGAAMLGSAVFALLGERLIVDSLVDGINGSPAGRFGWRLSIACHGLLFSIYATLAVACLVTGFNQCHANNFAVASIISGVSRPVLWGYISFLHLSYARLPTPYFSQRRSDKKRKGKLRILSREQVKDDDGAESEG